MFNLVGLGGGDFCNFSVEIPIEKLQLDDFSMVGFLLLVLRYKSLSDFFENFLGSADDFCRQVCRVTRRPVLKIETLLAVSEMCYFGFC
jgi:hypothetical protein